MGKRSETDKAIRNIMNWADRPEWSVEQAAVFDAHLAPVCDRIGINQEELVQELEEHGYGGILPFPREASQSLLRVLTESRKQFKKEFSRAVGKEAMARISPDNLDVRFLQDACPAFTSIWLVHTLERLPLAASTGTCLDTNQ